jgi:hypothetical protein
MARFFAFFFALATSVAIFIALYTWLVDTPFGGKTGSLFGVAALSALVLLLLSVGAALAPGVAMARGKPQDPAGAEPSGPAGDREPPS